jgi:prephenate dehydrogenase
MIKSVRQTVVVLCDKNMSDRQWLACVIKYVRQKVVVLCDKNLSDRQLPDRFDHT